MLYFEGIMNQCTVVTAVQDVYGIFYGFCGNSQGMALLIKFSEVINLEKCLTLSMSSL